MSNEATAAPTMPYPLRWIDEDEKAGWQVWDGHVWLYIPLANFLSGPDWFDDMGALEAAANFYTATMRYGVSSLEISRLPDVENYSDHFFEQQKDYSDETKR